MVTEGERKKLLLLEGYLGDINISNTLMNAKIQKLLLDLGVKYQTNIDMIMMLIVKDKNHVAMYCGDSRIGKLSQPKKELLCILFGEIVRVNIDVTRDEIATKGIGWVINNYPTLGDRLYAYLQDVYNTGNIFKGEVIECIQYMVSRYTFIRTPLHNKHNKNTVDKKYYLRLFDIQNFCII